MLGLVSLSQLVDGHTSVVCWDALLQLIVTLGTTRPLVLLAMTITILVYTTTEVFHSLCVGAFVIWQLTFLASVPSLAWASWLPWE